MTEILFSLHVFQGQHSSLCVGRHNTTSDVWTVAALCGVLTNAALCGVWTVAALCGVLTDAALCDVVLQCYARSVLAR